MNNEGRGIHRLKLESEMYSKWPAWQVIDKEVATAVSVG